MEKKPKVKRKSDDLPIKYDDASISSILEKQALILPPPPPLTPVLATPPPVIDDYLCFCFRKPDRFTMESWLNIAAATSSYYIHVEVCLFDGRDAKNTKSLYITKETHFVVFKEHVYVGDRWEFVWVKLSGEQRRQLKAAVQHIMTKEHTRTFSSWNIFLFHLFALPCYFSIGEPRTRTCSEMTVEIIKHICPDARGIGNSFSYTPEDIYRLLQDLSQRRHIIIDRARANFNPKEQ